MIEFPLIIDRFETTTEIPPDEKDWEHSAFPKPCACGSVKLELIETESAVDHDKQRTAIRCPKCGALGQDTCHGKTAAVQRWNWHGDQRAVLQQPAADIIPMSRR